MLPLSIAAMASLTVASVPTMALRQDFMVSGPYSRAFARAGFPREPRYIAAANRGVIPRSRRLQASIPAAQFEPRPAPAAPSGRAQAADRAAHLEPWLGPATRRAEPVPSASAGVRCLRI